MIYNHRIHLTRYDGAGDTNTLGGTMVLTYHDLRILTKVATGQHIADEADDEMLDLVKAGFLIYSATGTYDISSEVHRKFDRILRIWEEL